MHASLPTGPIHVVDKNRHDYDEVAKDSRLAEGGLRFFSTGREALRTNPEEEPALWVVNQDLPDMQGTDLLEMLRVRGGIAPIILVGDVYDPALEIEARVAGASLFFTKPLIAEWLVAPCLIEV
jgi:FixJ family two-component response regulator